MAATSVESMTMHLDVPLIKPLSSPNPYVPIYSKLSLFMNPSNLLHLVAWSPRGNICGVNIQKASRCFRIAINCEPTYLPTKLA